MLIHGSLQVCDSRSSLSALIAILDLANGTRAVSQA